MASKLSLALVFVCLLQVCLSARIIRDLETTNTNSSSEELTASDVSKIQQELSQVMPPENAARFANIMRKFTKGSTSAENKEGVVELFAMALAGQSGKSEDEWKKLFADSSEEKDKKMSV